MLPILALLCLVGHVLLSESRRRGLLRAALGLAVTALLLLAAVGIGRTLYLDAINQHVLPRQAAADIFDSLIVAHAHVAAHRVPRGLILAGLRCSPGGRCASRSRRAAPRLRAAASARGRRPAHDLAGRPPRRGAVGRRGVRRDRARRLEQPDGRRGPDRRRADRARGVARRGARAQWTPVAAEPPRRRVGDRLEQAIEHRADVPAELARGEQELEARAREAAGSLRRTIFWLAVSAVSLYLVAPSVIAALGSWRQIERLSPAWLAAMAALQAASLACIWALQLLSLRGARWQPVIASQLAGNALAKIAPGGGAMGVGAAVPDARRRRPAARPAVVSGLTASTLLAVRDRARAAGALGARDPARRRRSATCSTRRSPAWWSSCCCSPSAS